MSIKVSLRQLEEQLAELLESVAETGQEYIVQRNGKDYAVIVNVRQWRRRTVGQQLDALGSGYRLAKDKQARVEQLLAAKERRTLTAAEQRELRSRLRECDSVLQRRAAAMDQLR